MTDLGLRPRSSTELVDAAFQVFRRTPVQFIVAAAVVYVPWLVIQLAFNLEITGETLPGFDVLAVNLIAGVAVYVILSGVITRVARDVYFDHQPDVAAAFRMMGARVLPLLGVSLVVLLTMALALFVPGLILGLLARSRVLLLTAMPFALIFCLISVLYALSRFFAARQSVVLESTGVGAALSRSSSLSVGVKGHILTTLLLAGLLTFAIMLGTALISELIPSHVVKRAIVTIVTVCVKPFFSIAETLLYYDVRIRKEAFDVEYMANAEAALSSAPSAAL